MLGTTLIPLFPLTYLTHSEVAAKHLENHEFQFSKQPSAKCTIHRKYSEKSAGFDDTAGSRSQLEAVRRDSTAVCMC
jgi:hypothetical protein